MYPVENPPKLNHSEPYYAVKSTITCILLSATAIQFAVQMSKDKC